MVNRRAEIVVQFFENGQDGRLSKLLAKLERQYSTTEVENKKLWQQILYSTMVDTSVSQNDKLNFGNDRHYNIMIIKLNLY